MTRRTLLAMGAFAAGVAVLWGVLFWAVPRWFRGAPDTATAPASAAKPVDPAAARKITATLYYISEDGMALVPQQREIPHGELLVDQARHIVQAQLDAAPAPLASALPAGTTLRAIYVGDRGDLFIDLSADVTRNHTGGALDELFTVYALVNAVTINLPSIHRVQLLVDGKEADTLAGHVDIRNPLSRNLTWVKTDNPS